MTLDTLDMFKATIELPEQMALAKKSYETLDLIAHENIENVLILGMGGSSIAGDIAVSFANQISPVPVSVIKSYEVPAFVDTTTLVIAISFSGNTEETVIAAEECFEAGACMVAVSSGGNLKKLASDWDISHIELPSSIPQPRAAIGAMTVPVLLILEQVGLIPGASNWLDVTINHLMKLKDIYGSSLIEHTANSLVNTIPLIYSSYGIGQVAVDRFKKQINENVKSPAFSNLYPELCHNELAGWGIMGDVTRQAISLVQIKFDNVHPQMLRRMKWVKDQLTEQVKDIIEIKAHGDCDLCQLFDIIYKTDLISLKMADILEIDPGPIPILNELKEYLKS